MKDYAACLIDLDGTIYRGNQVIADAPEFIQWLNSRSIPFQFLTNNSALPPEKVAHKLNAMGIPCRPDQVFTTSLAAAELISTADEGNRVYAIGEEGLLKALEEAGCVLTEKDPDYVVIGIDRQITYEKLATASLAVQKGAVFLSTNSDRAVPSEVGLVPGNGAITAAVSVASGTAPRYIGKPEALFVDLALKRLNRKPEEVLLIGDNLHTDIAAGAHAGVDTLLVYTGITRREDVAESTIKPTYEAEDLTAWMRSCC